MDRARGPHHPERRDESEEGGEKRDEQGHLERSGPRVGVDPHDLCLHVRRLAGRDLPELAVADEFGVMRPRSTSVPASRGAWFGGASLGWSTRSDHLADPSPGRPEESPAAMKEAATLGRLVPVEDRRRRLDVCQVALHDLVALEPDGRRRLQGRGERQC